MMICSWVEGWMFKEKNQLQSFKYAKLIPVVQLSPAHLSTLKPLSIPKDWWTCIVWRVLLVSPSLYNTKANFTVFLPLFLYFPLICFILSLLEYSINNIHNWIFKSMISHHTWRGSQWWTFKHPQDRGRGSIVVQSSSALYWVWSHLWPAKDSALIKKKKNTCKIMPS